MKDYNITFNKKALNLILGLMLLTIVGAAVDTIVYIINANFLLVYLNLSLFVLLIGISLAAFFEKISLSLTTYVFSYAVIINVGVTNYYLRVMMSPVWELSFLRDTSIVLLFMLFISIVLTKRDLIIYIVIVSIYHGIYAYTSNSSFIKDNILVITVAIFGGGIIIFWITDLLKKTLARNRFLEQKYKEREGNRTTME